MFYHFLAGQLAKFLQQSFSLKQQKDVIFSWLLGYHDNQTVATFSQSPATDTGKGREDSHHSLGFFVTKATVCWLRTENMFLQIWKQTVPTSLTDPVLSPSSITVRKVFSLLSFVQVKKLYSASSSLFLALSQLGCRNWELLMTEISSQR